MTNQEIQALVESFGIQANISEAQYLTIEVTHDKIHTFAQKLKDNVNTQMDYLVLITGVDYKTSFGCTYMLNSSRFNHTVVLKTKDIDKNNPEIDTVCDLWQTANFLEREIYDLIGIKFKNHPDLRRLFLEETWVGHPLRKDYSDDVNMIERKS